jgi:hypothetical protein
MDQHATLSAPVSFLKASFAGLVKPDSSTCCNSKKEVLPAREVEADRVD